MKRNSRYTNLTILYTGNGKGKSSAAFGGLCRALNQRWKVLVIQFVKSKKWHSGEYTIFKDLSTLSNYKNLIQWEHMGTGWSWLQASYESDPKDKALSGWLYVKELINSNEYDYYILDEFTYPILWKWINIDEVISTFNERQYRQHIIMTGRYADQKLIDISTLVTYMDDKKHPLRDLNQKGQKGIEW